MQLTDNLCLRVLVLDVEPLIKLLCAREDLGQQEVEQRPQLMQVVLQGRSCSRQSINLSHSPMSWYQRNFEAHITLAIRVKVLHSVNNPIVFPEGARMRRIPVMSSL